MRISDYREQLNALEVKLRDLVNVRDQFAFGYALVVLSAAITEIEAEIAEISNMVVQPAPIINYLTVGSPALSLNVGDTSQLVVTATLSDGTARDVTKLKRAYTAVADGDSLANAGKIMSVNTTAYTGEDATYFLEYSGDGGWQVVDRLGTKGMYVMGLSPDEFGIYLSGHVATGVKFMTDGNEVAHDNYSIKIRVEENGTSYSPFDDTIVSVSAEGLVTALASGNTTIYVSNGDAPAEPVTVVVT